MNSTGTSVFDLSPSEKLQLVEVRVPSCSLVCFVDRMARNPKHTIHDFTLNLTNQHEPMPMLDVDRSLASNQSATFCARPR